VPALLWISSQAPGPDREYLVLASELRPRHLLAGAGFMRIVLHIRRQLAGAKGLVGYSLDAWPLARRYWNLSACEDRAAFFRFVGRKLSARSKVRRAG
jgi:hypothetical protein